jgi:hypothetical protein
VGRYTKAYTGTLALVCSGSIAVAVHAHDKAAKLGDLNASADRWETWAGNQRLRDERAYARFREVARQYRSLARRVERSQRLLLHEIAVTRSLRRTVVTGSPIVTYVRIQKLVPVVTAPSASTTAPASRTSAPAATAPTQKPLTTRKAKKPGAKGAPAPPGGAPAPGATAPGATAAPGAGAAGSAPGSTSAPGAGSAGGTTTTTGPPPTLAAPANTKPPLIVGTPQSSKPISADPGSWTGSPTSYTYQWQRCDATGAGCVVVGSGQSYTCVAQDIDKTMRVAVTAANSAGSAVAVSAASPKTKPS